MCNNELENIMRFFLLLAIYNASQANICVLIIERMLCLCIRLNISITLFKVRFVCNWFFMYLNSDNSLRRKFRLVPEIKTPMFGKASVSDMLLPFTHLKT